MTLLERQEENELLSSKSSTGFAVGALEGGWVSGDGDGGVGPRRSLSETGGSESEESWVKVFTESCGGMVPRPSSDSGRD